MLGHLTRPSHRSSRATAALVLTTALATLVTTAALTSEASAAPAVGPRAGHPALQLAPSARAARSVRSLSPVQSSGRSSYRQLTTTADFASGTSEAVAIGGDALRMQGKLAKRRFARKTWAFSRWTSPLVFPGQSFTQLIPSWDAVTPPGTWVEAQVRGLTSSGASSGWKVMARWSSRDASFRRTSAGSQPDGLARAATDTFTAQPGVTFTGYQLRVLLQHRAGLRRTPTLRSLGAVATLPAATVPATSTPLLGARVLPVPMWSQMTHRGQYPGYGGGGEAWCSPTSLSMLLGYYNALPPAQTYSWVSQRYSDRWVDHVARATYDFGYRGTGNWAFNTAYATNRGLDAFVTRLADLREAERFVAAGIPLAASISFGRGGLSGAPISATAGHLVVITGFTGNGNVVVNDPAAPSNASVQRVYDRAQFERAWQERSAGTVYVVHDAAHPLPARGPNHNW